MRRFLLLLLALATTATAAPRPLDPMLREKLRYRLESMRIELELLVRNQKSHAREAARQRRLAELLKLPERIPTEPRGEQLRAELLRSARLAGIRLRGLRLLPPKKRADGLVEELPLEMLAEGPGVSAWVRAWPAALTRWVEPMAEPAAAGDAWRIRARSFRFLTLPGKRYQDPARDLPAAALQDPQLSALLARIRKVGPRAAPLLAERVRDRELAARVAFLLRKTGLPHP